MKAAAPTKAAPTSENRKPVQRHAAKSEAARLAAMPQAAPGPAGWLAAMAPARPAAPAGVPAGLAASVERLSGVSLKGVRVHHGSAAPGRIGARAFARGDEVHIGPGQAASLPHELWHVTQQRRGQVQASARLADGTPLNDTPALEREARSMGARAWAERHAAGGPLPVQMARLAQAADVLQPDWYFNGAAWKWVEPGTPAPHGYAKASPPNSSYAPFMIHPQAKGYTTIDENGDVTRTYGPVSSAQKAPGRDALARAARNAGKDLATRSAKLSDKDMDAHIGHFTSLAEQLEDIAGDSLPKKHGQKVHALYNEANFKPAQYRAIIGGQDEMFRTSTAGAFFLKYGEEINKNPGLSQAKRDKMHHMGAAMMRVASAIRTPTQGVVATTEDASGQTVGSQHPTSKDIPILTGGRSGHGLNDPLRASKALGAYLELSQDGKAPPHAMFNAMMLATVVGTLNHMMFPGAAGNVPLFNQARLLDQMQEREDVKSMGNVLAGTIDVPTHAADPTRPYNADTMATEAPTSPRRDIPPH